MASDHHILERVRSIVHSQLIPCGVFGNLQELSSAVVWPKTPNCDGRIAIVRTTQYKCPFSQRVHDSNTLYFLVNLETGKIKLRCYRCEGKEWPGCWRLTDPLAVLTARREACPVDWDAMAAEQLEEMREAKRNGDGPWLYQPVLIPPTLQEWRQRVEDEIRTYFCDVNLKAC